MNILLIDSSAEEHTRFKLALQQLNVGVLYFGVTSCDDALSNLATQEIAKPDYIFLDIDMPVVDGYGCLKLFEGGAHLRGIPVATYSTSEHAVDMAYILKHGAYLNLAKGRSFVTLCSALKDLFVAGGWLGDSSAQLELSRTNIVHAS
jgi:PleD family two-component response regulator